MKILVISDNQQMKTDELIDYCAALKSISSETNSFEILILSSKIPKPFRWLIYFFKAMRVTGKYDVIFALNATRVGVPVLWATKIKKKKFFVKVTGDSAWEMAMSKNETHFLINDFQQSKKSGVIKLVHQLQVWVIKNAQGVIVSSEYLVEIVKGWGIDVEKIKIVYDGIEFKETAMSREEARKKIGILGTIILSSGPLMPWKGFKMLVKIMPQVLDVSQIFRLVIVGDGPDMAILKLMVRNMGLERKVFLVGAKTHQELAIYMASADLFVLDTGYEGSPHQVLVAMSAGVPVITTAVGANREIMKQGENGFMVKYNDEFNLVEAIKSVWKNPELREEFIIEGKKTAKKFSVQKMCEETIAFLAN